MQYIWHRDHSELEDTRMPDTEISQETSRENCKGDIQIQRDHNDGSENKSKIFEDVERAAILG